MPAGGEQAWPGGAGAHRLAGEAIEAQESELAERTVRECRRLWVLDAEQQWHGGVLALGGDGEPGGPYPHDGWASPEGPTLVLAAGRGGPWQILRAGGGAGAALADVRSAAEVVAAANRWEEADGSWREAGWLLDLEAVENGEPLAVAAAERVKVLAEGSLGLAWEALEAAREALGAGSAVSIVDASGRLAGAGWPAPAAAALATEESDGSDGSGTLYFASYAPLPLGRNGGGGAAAAIMGGALGSPPSRNKGDIADDEAPWR